MNNSIKFLHDIHVDGNIETNGLSKAINTNVWIDSGSENEMIVSIKGEIHGSEDQNIITDYSQLMGVPIKVKKHIGIEQDTFLGININDLGAKECKHYANDSDSLEGTFSKFSIKTGQIIELVWNGDCFIALSNR